MADIQLPVDHLSYSALRTLVSNSWLFKKRYLLGIYEDTAGPALHVGKSFHKFAELLHKGESFDKANKFALKYLDEIPDSKIDYGKTGSREKMVRELSTAITNFLEHKPDVSTILGVETVVTTEFQVDGLTAPLPVKAVSDLVTREADGIHIWDWKTCKSFTDPKTENPNFIMQAMFNYYTIKAKFEEPVAMHYFEVKTSKPRDGIATNIYSIEYDKHPEYITLFLKMYEGALRMLANPDTVFMPNFSDILGGGEAWEDFVSETFDFNMPTQVTHRSAAVKNVDTQFIQSKVETADTPEEKIVAKFLEFGIALEPAENHRGSNVTLHAFKPSRGVRMNKIAALEPDVSQALGARSVRILAPIKGTSYVGVEVSNETAEVVPFTTDLLVDRSLSIPVGQDVYGNTKYIELDKAPHLLVAGATGSGKSVFLNVIIESLTQQNTASDLKLMLIDPKRTEFNMYSHKEHLETKILSEVEETSYALEWLVKEMENRYKDLQRYEAKNVDELEQYSRIVVVIDEMADLLLSSEYYLDAEGKKIKYSEGIERNMLRLLQKSRASGIHLVLATQRPSVDVIKGTLKANLPTRVSFMTSSKADSQVILDQPGAEALLGNGDLLLMNPRELGLVRLQGYYL